MKKRIISFIYFFLVCTVLNAQLVNTLKGTIVSSETKRPMQHVVIAIDKTTISHQTDSHGDFNLTHIPNGNLVVEISYQGYESQFFPITMKRGETITLGTIFLSKIPIELHENEGSISLTEDDLNNDQGESENTTGMLFKIKRPSIGGKLSLEFAVMVLKIP